MKSLIKLFFLFGLVACSDFKENTITLRFSPEEETKASANLNELFSKLNIMLFDSAGNKALDKVKTQTISEEGFGTLSLTLGEGTYTVVAVGHSSYTSATIKSPSSVQFTAHEGEKLTDTFSIYKKITVSGKETYNLIMERVVAMFRLRMTDEEVPQEVVKVKFEYTGGSANYNPITKEGTTKSSQSELKQRTANNVYEVFTFPYQNASGTLKITVSAIDKNDVVIESRTFENVPVTRNMITEYKGEFFSGSSNFTGNTFVFSADPSWDGTMTFDF